MVTVQFKGRVTHEVQVSLVGVTNITQLHKRVKEVTDEDVYDEEYGLTPGYLCLINGKSSDLFSDDLNLEDISVIKYISMIHGG